MSSFLLRIKHTQKSQGGFSLLEILLYVAIIGIVTLVLSGTFLVLARGQGRVESRTAVNSNLRFGIEKVAQDIRSATALTIPAIAGNSGSTLAVTVSGSTVTYCVVSGQLRRAPSGSACDAASPVVTNSSVTVSSFTVTRLENTNTLLSRTAVSIRVSMTVAYNSNAPDSQYTETKQVTITLR